MLKLSKLIVTRIKSLDIVIPYPVVFWMYFIFTALVVITSCRDGDRFSNQMCFMMSPLFSLFYMFSFFALISPLAMFISIPLFIVLMNLYKLIKKENNLKYFLEKTSSIITIIFIVNLIISFGILLVCQIFSKNNSFCLNLFS